LGSSSSENVELEIKVKIKCNLKHGFSAGDKEESPEQKELDNALAQVWDHQGENLLYEQNMMDNLMDGEDDVWEEERSLYDNDESTCCDDDDNDDDSYNDEERDEASCDNRTEMTGEVFLDDNDEKSCYAVMSTHTETEIKLEVIESADIEHAEAYLDSVLRHDDDDSNSNNNDNEENDNADENNETKKALSREEESSAVVRYDNQDYFLAVLSHVGKEYTTKEDVDKTIAIVEDDPYEEPTSTDEPRQEAPTEQDEANEKEDALQKDALVFQEFELWMKELKQEFLLLKGLLSSARATTQQHRNNDKDDILGASDAMATKVKGLVRPLLEPGYESKRFYMDDDVQSSSSDESSVDGENDDHAATRRRRSIRKRQSKSSIRGRGSGIPRELRIDRNEHSHSSLHRASSLDSVLQERVIGPGERNIASFLKTHLGVDLHNDKVDEREYKEFVGTYFMDSRLLNYQRMRQHHIPTQSTNDGQRRRSKSTDAQGRRRNKAQQTRSTRRKSSKMHHRTMLV